MATARCLLCGAGDAKGGLPRCGWCEQEAASLNPEEVLALQKLEEIPIAFHNWQYTRDSVSGHTSVTRLETPVPQPAQVLPKLPLYLGDLEHAADVSKLRSLGIGCVINLCADKLVTSQRYKDVPSLLAKARIHQHILVADDAKDFKILEVVLPIFSIINATLAKETRNGVLVHCWAGMNRSAACVVAFLVTQYQVPLYAAVAQTMKQRGNILENQSFRAQLVRFCFKEGLDLRGEKIPNHLLEPLPDPVTLGDNQSCNDPAKQHKREAPKDSDDHGLRFAVREGCLKCVSDYVQRGVDPEKKGKNYSALGWAEWKLDRASDDQERRQYKAILVCLQRGPRELQENGEQAKS